jgi:hypothetical protein
MQKTHKEITQPPAGPGSIANHDPVISNGNQIVKSEKYNHIKILARELNPVMEVHHRERFIWDWQRARVQNYSR